MALLASLYQLTILPSFTRCRPTTFFKGSLDIQRRFIGPPRHNISTYVPLSGKAIAQVDGQTSLAWLQLHDQSPASYGVQAFDGYLELIPPKTPLPCKKSEVMESAFDYVCRVTFGICYRRTMLDVPVEIAEDAELDNIRPAKKGEAKFKVTMRMGKDLIGDLTVQDTWTRNKVFIKFDGGRALQERSDTCHAMITS